MKKDVFEAWKKSGLLEGLSKVEGVCLAEAFEEIANFLINLEIVRASTEKDKDISGMIFPIIRRIFNRKKNIDTKDIYKELSVYYDDKFEHYKDIYGADPKIDYEAEFCAAFFDYYVDVRKLLLVKKRLELNGKKI